MRERTVCLKSPGISRLHRYSNSAFFCFFLFLFVCLVWLVGWLAGFLGCLIPQNRQSVFEGICQQNFYVLPHTEARTFCARVVTAVATLLFLVGVFSFGLI